MRAHFANNYVDQYFFIFHSSYFVIYTDFVSSFNLHLHVETQNVGKLGMTQSWRIRKPREDCVMEYPFYSILYGPGETLSTDDFL